jgi:ubiquinol-cytochrome c reductase cytochrome c subunit
VKWITARRRHPLAGYVVVILALALFGVGYAAVAPTSDQAQAQTLAADVQSPEDVDVAEGKTIFDQTCASCHGLDGSGGEFGPDLRDVGPAAIDFQVSTGRMPSMNPDAQMPRKPMVMTEQELANLIAYYNESIRSAATSTAKRPTKRRSRRPRPSTRPHSRSTRPSTTATSPVSTTPTWACACT